MQKGLVKSLALDLDVKSVASSAKASMDSKIAEVGADIELLTRWDEKRAECSLGEIPPLTGGAVVRDLAMELGLAWQANSDALLELHFPPEDHGVVIIVSPCNHNGTIWVWILGGYA